MSAIGGPNIGKDALDKLIYNFTPEDNGLSLIGTAISSNVFPIPKSSFNKVTSSISPFYDPPTYLNDGWWGTNGRALYDPNVIANAPNQTPSGHYTPYLNNNINNFQFTTPYAIDPSFLQNGITVCGFINVDRFPRISLLTKKKLGVSRIRVSDDTNFRVGVRKANNSSKFNFGLQVSFLKNLRFSICTDYNYDVGKWYFYSAHFRFIDDSNGTVQGRMTVNGNTVITHFDSSFGYFNKRFVVNNATRLQYKGQGTSVGNSYPVNVGFLNSSNITAFGTQASNHEYTIVGNNFQCGVGNVKGGPLNIGNLTSTGILSNVDPLIIRFLELFKERNGGFSGYHDNIRLGQHFFFNDYNIDVERVYNSYKSIYL